MIHRCDIIIFKVLVDIPHFLETYLRYKISDMKQLLIYILNHSSPPIKNPKTIHIIKATILAGSNTNTPAKLNKLQTRVCF